MLIISFIDFREPELNKLRELFKEHRFVWYRDPDFNDALLAQAEVILGNPKAEQLRLASRLVWMQTMTAGVDVYLAKGLLGDAVQLTNCSGSFGLAIAELMVVQLGMLLKKMHLYQRNQLQGLWRDEGQMQSFQKLKVLIVGLGNLGDTFGRKLHALGCAVSGMRREVGHREDYLEALYSVDSLPDVIGEFDVVASFLPKTPQTYHLFNLEMLSKMKRSAYLLNAGRGDAIALDDLVQALKDSLIGGAALDVVEFEPLPREHPLWRFPNVIITPHAAGWFNLKQTYDAVYEIVYENSQRFINGETLKNLYDRKENRTLR